MTDKIVEHGTTIVLSVMVFILLVALLGWMRDRDAQIRAASIQYEECVKREYGMTPIKWYEDNGKYPDCDWTK